MMDESKREGLRLMTKLLARETGREKLPFIGVENITGRTGLGVRGILERVLHALN